VQKYALRINKQIITVIFQMVKKLYHTCNELIRQKLFDNAASLGVELFSQ